MTKTKAFDSFAGVMPYLVSLSNALCLNSNFQLQLLQS